MDQGLRPALVRRSIRRRWWVIVVALLVGVGAGTVLFISSDTDYRATSVIFLEPLVGNPYSPTTPSGRQEGLAALTTEAGLVLGDSVVRSAEAAAGRAGIDLGSQIQERTSTEVPSNSQVIHISFTASSPATAQFGAEALASAYLEYRQGRSEQVIDGQLGRIDEEISSLSSLVDIASEALTAAEADDAPENPAEIEILEEQVRVYANQLGQLRIERVSVEGASTSPGELVSPPLLPDQPEGLPAALIATAVALFLMGAGVIMAVILEHLDTRLRSKDEIEQMGIGPVYGVVPVWQPALSGTVAEDSYRLATISTRQGVHAVLGADGPVPLGVAAGLAHTIAEIGCSVILVLANPINRGTGSYPGLSDALRSGEAPEVAGLYQARAGIRVLGAGQQPEELPRLVQGPRFVTLITTLARQCDTLLLVGPEACSATGAAVANVSETTLLVSVAGQTRESDLLASTRMVQQSDGRMRGVLLSERRPGRGWRAEPATTPGWAGLAALLAVEETRPTQETPRQPGARVHEPALPTDSD